MPSSGTPQPPTIPLHYQTVVATIGLMLQQGTRLAQVTVGFQYKVGEGQGFVLTPQQPTAHDEALCLKIETTDGQPFNSLELLQVLDAEIDDYRIMAQELTPTAALYSFYALIPA